MALQDTKTASEGRSAFFYGTLMAPQVLHRVCHGGMQADNAVYAAHTFKSHSAILHDYRRSKVVMADYPAIFPQKGSSARGTYVTGLTDNDIWRLDIFEGSEYSREKVRIRLLTVAGDDTGEGNVEGDEVQAETYVFKQEHADRIEKEEWDFAVFSREKMRFWVGSEGEGEYAEVDEAVAQQFHDGTGGRGANGHISKALTEEHNKNESPEPPV